jgi:uncharacterized Rmd1/YagE family protein
MDELIKYLQSKKKTNGTAPKRFDECLYTPYAFTYPIAPPANNTPNTANTTNPQRLPEIFLFDYGVVGKP